MPTKRYFSPVSNYIQVSYIVWFCYVNRHIFEGHVPITSTSEWPKHSDCGIPKNYKNFEFLIEFLDGTRQSLELQIEARRQQDTFNLQITPLIDLKCFFSIDISNWQTKILPSGNLSDMTYCLLNFVFSSLEKTIIDQ